MLEKYKESQAEFYYYTKSIIENKKFSHAYFIETNNVENYESIIIDFVKEIFKLDDDNPNLDSLIESGNYPDLYIVRPESNKDNTKKSITASQIDDLLNSFKTKANKNYKIYIIFDADLLTKDTANKILKFLEEPEDGIIGIITSSNKDLIISTILSRCQLISLKSEEYNIESLDNMEITIELLRLLEEKKSKSIAYIKDLNSIKDFKSIDRDTFKNILNNFLLFFDLVLKYKYIDNYKEENEDIDKLLTELSNFDISEIARKQKVISETIKKLEANTNISLTLYSFLLEY